MTPRPDETSREQRSDLSRLKGLSDGVFAIVLTLLVLNLIPDGPRSPAQLLAAWPSYLAYLAAFLTIASIWLNHNAAFSRIRHGDPAVLVLNLVLLLGAALVPWPTVLIANAFRSGNRTDQISAMIVFSTVALLLSLPWTALDRHVARRPHLLAEEADVAWMRRHARWSDASILLAIVTVGIAFLSPVASLIVYLPAVLGFVISRLVERD